MGIGFTPTYSRHRFRVSPGDRMLLFTDGVLETTSPDDTPFDTHGIETLLNREPAVARTLRAASWRPSTDMRRPTNWHTTT